jgi:N-acetylneuraminate synthase/N,N'-diacetyllegionaminate synthase
VKIGKIDTDQEVYVIAEIGGNHNGDADTAYRMVEAAAKAGAHAVKFQTFKAELLVHPSTEPLPLVRKNYKTQLERFKSLELDEKAYQRILEMCDDLGVDFMTSTFDLNILARMAPLMPAIKVASGDLTYDQLLQSAAATGKPIILSTGMSDPAEITRAAGFVPHERLALLHCVSIYPLPDEQANLGAIPAMKKLWPDITIGYSDHARGIDACVAAVALGARVIEKHFTLDKTQVPGDHVHSAEPQDLEVLMRMIKRIEPMLGTEQKKSPVAEDGMRRWMRRGIYAARSLPAGHKVGPDDLLVIRPMAALAPEDFDRVVGSTLSAPVEAFAAIEPSVLCH